MKAPTATLLPLDTWRDILGYHPFHFWGMSNSTALRVDSRCNGLVREYAYQDAQQIGREDIRKAIASAEDLITKELRYAPAPHYVSLEAPYPPYYDAGARRTLPLDADGRAIGVQLSEGYIQALGVEALTLLAELKKEL